MPCWVRNESAVPMRGMGFQEQILGNNILERGVLSKKRCYILSF